MQAPRTPPPRSSEKGPASTSGEARPGLLSLRVKALLLFLGVGLAPVALATLRLIGVNQDAVVLGEQKLQTSVLAEVSGSSLRSVSEARSDVEAIANALSLAATTKASEEDELRAVNALLGTRKAIDGYRLEVPRARVSVTAGRKAVGPSSGCRCSAGITWCSTGRGPRCDPLRDARVSGAAVAGGPPAWYNLGPQLALRRDGVVWQTTARPPWPNVSVRWIRRTA